MGKQLSGPRDLRLIFMCLAYDCGEVFVESPLLRTVRSHDPSPPIAIPERNARIPEQSDRADPWGW